MKYTIFGYKQEELLKNSIDGNDLIILDYLIYQLLNSSLEKILIDDKVYIWIKNEMIIKDLPFLKMQERGLRNRLERLMNDGFIERKSKCIEGSKIKKAYTTITQKTYDLKFDNKSIKKDVSNLYPECIQEKNSKNAQNQQVAEATSSFQETNALIEEIKCLKKEIEMLKNNNKEINKEIPFKEIIDYLNEKVHTRYMESSKETQKHISARWNEGFRLDDFKKVIDNKCKDWLGTSFEQYLRPNVLFSPKFEGYLNAKIVKKVDKTTPYGWEGDYVDPDIDEF